MSETFEVVSINDPHIDRERLTLDAAVKYAHERDMSTIRPYFVHGKEPMIFVCREIPHSLFVSYVKSAPSDDLKQYRAFACGVDMVLNMVQADGRNMGNWTPPRSTNGKPTPMDDESVERFAPNWIEEIGSVIYQRSFLDRRIKVDFPLPPMSAVISDRLGYRPADASPSEQAKSSNEACSDSASHPSSQEATTAEPTKQGDDSGAPTAAPATETLSAGG